MEKLKSVLELLVAAGGVVGFVWAGFRWSARRIRANKAKRIVVSFKYFSAHDDFPVFKIVMKNEVGRPVLVERAGLYDPNAVGRAKFVTSVMLGKTLDDGAVDKLLAPVDATEEDLAFLDRLRPYAVDERGKVHLGLAINPDEIRAAFAERDNPRILAPQLGRRAPTFAI